MKKINIPVGISDFSELGKGYYYIDKTGLVAQIVKNDMAKVTLITRPRRFGKTLGMSMLANFFDITKDSRKLFEGLEISKYPEICAQWMNQYPVLFLSFKDIDGTTFENAFGLFEFLISTYCDEHAYLKEGENITDNQRELFDRLIFRKASFQELQNSLLTIMKMMQSYYGKPVILLLDEYDVPIAKANQNGYYAQMLEVIKTIMSTALKDNTSLKFAVVTGCLKIAKESIFTGTNNFVSDSITASRFNEYFGFTQKEVDKLLEDADALKYAEDMKKWYDGYHFGDYDIYCPWDVMNYLRDIQCRPEAKPASYWKNTSDNEIIRSFIDYAGSSITKKLETLMAGGYIIQQVEENLTYDYIHSSEENLWSILYLTGYLTTMREEQLETELPDGMSALTIPNAEVREIFETSVKKWFDDSAKTYDRKTLFDAVWEGDSEKLTAEMNRLLRMTISYHDYKEDFYHAFLAGIFAGAGYAVQSNKEHGEGRSDIVVTDIRGAKAAVFEAKYSKTLNKMQDDCEKALAQIDERMYAKEYEDDYDEVFCYGISFYKKRCVVRRK